MNDIYDSQSATATMPAAGGFTIVPDDESDLSFVTRAVYVGSGGDLVAELSWGGTVSFRNVPTGALLPIRAKKILSASTASLLVGLY